MKRVLPRVEVRPDVSAPSTIDTVRSLRPDLIVSWFWTTRLPPALVACAPRGGFGVHPSLLPKHRGPDPYFWAIDSGDRVTGVTAHRLLAEYDTGEIFGQEPVVIDPTWSAWTLARALDRPSLALLREIALVFAATEDPPGAIPQNESLATLAPSPTDEELEIDWTWSTARILRRIRAASPSPGAWSFFGDEPVTITRAIAAEPGDFPRALAPGEAWVADAGPEANTDISGIIDAPPQPEHESGEFEVSDVASVPTGAAFVRTGDGAVALIAGRMESADDDEPWDLDVEDLADMVRELRG